MLDKMRYSINILLFIIFLIIVFNYIKGQYSFTSAIIMILLVILFVLGIVNKGPYYITKIQTTLDDITSEEAAWESLLLGMEEEYKELDTQFITYMDIDRHSFLTNLNTTLYKFDYDDMSSILSAYHDKGGSLSRIKDHYLMDKVQVNNSYMFIQGDDLKMRLADLFNNERLHGSIDPETGIYQVKYQRLSASNYDYYMIYSQILENLTYRLNTYSKVVRPTRKQYTYSSGIVKDSFLVKSYFTSLIFWDWDNVQAIENKLRKSFRGADTALVDATISDIVDTYLEHKEDLSSEDFLGLEAILEGQTLGSSAIGSPTDFSEPSLKRAIRETNWFKVAKSNGYIEPAIRAEANVTNAQLVAYHDAIKDINAETIEFVNRMVPHMSYVSDENMMKLIALKATFEFNSRMSKPFNAAHPQRLDLGDFNMEQLMQVSLLDKEDRYTREYTDLTYYVAKTLSPLALPVLALDVIVVYANRLLVNNLLLIATLLFILIFLLNIIKKRENIPIDKIILNYLSLIVKFSFLYFIANYVNNLVLLKGEILGVHIGLLIRMILSIVTSIGVISVSIKTLVAVFKNPLNLGGDDLIVSRQIFESYLYSVRSKFSKKNKIDDLDRLQEYKHDYDWEG